MAILAYRDRQKMGAAGGTLQNYCIREKKLNYAHLSQTSYYMLFEKLI